MTTNSEWTDELKATVIEAYTKSGPTAENTMEIVAELAEEYGKTINGIRMILTKAGVYVKKTGGVSTSKEPKEGATKKNSKETLLAELTAVIAEAGQEVNAEIIGRLTGKAAEYFTGIIKNLNK
jgi:hypothetical protein